MVNSITILLVEDNPDHAFLAIEGLKKAGFLSDVKVVEDGQQALEYLNREGKYNNPGQYPMPDLILLDIRLPKKSGIEVLEIIKKKDNLKNIPVIMLTSSKRDEDILDSYHNGANSYVTKPVNFTEFSEKLKDIQRYWCITNTLPSEVISDE